jgi:hypothetical protein
MAVFPQKMPQDAFSGRVLTSTDTAGLLAAGALGPLADEEMTGAGMQISIAETDELAVPSDPAEWSPQPGDESAGGLPLGDLPAGQVVLSGDDHEDFDEEDFDDEFDDDFEEELEDEYELSEFEDVTEDDLIEADDDIGTLGGDFVDEDAEPEEAPVEEEPAGEEDEPKGKKGKGKAKPKKKSDDDDEEDEEDDEELLDDED